MKCAHCGKEFEPKSVNHRYCSRQCQMEAARADWKALGILKTCEWCYKEFEATNSRVKYCSEACRKKAASEYVKQCEARKKAKQLTDEKVSRKPKTLDEWSREATACGLDYGNYRALIEQGGKTFEELKAQADNRCVQIHAHGNVHSTH